MLVKSVTCVGFVFAAVVAFSSVSEARNLKVSIHVDQENVKSAFARKSGSDWYVLESTDSIKKTKIRGEGLLAMVNKDKEERDRSVLGIDSEGYDRVRFEKNPDGNIQMIREVWARIPAEGMDPIEISVTSRIPIVFESGSWEDYQAGKKVEIAFTPEGKRAFLDLLQRKLVETLDRMAKSFKAKGVDVSDITVDEIKADDSASLKLDQDLLVLRGGNSTVEASFKVDLDL